MNKSEDVIKGMVNKYGCFTIDTEFHRALDRSFNKFMEEMKPTLDALPFEHLVIASNYIVGDCACFLAPYVLHRQMVARKERRAAIRAKLKNKIWLWACREMVKIQEENNEQRTVQPGQV